MLPSFTRAPGAPPFLIAGPCVIESETLCLGVAERLHRIGDDLGIPVIFKASFDKANRTSVTGFRGHGLEEGLRVLEKVRREAGLPVLTDVHLPDQVAPVAEVVDMLQTPAFLARQTDLISAAAASGRPVNIKKAQFMAPADMAAVLGKARAAAGTAGVAYGNILLCERGSSFGYNNLVVDMRGLVIMREMGCPVVFDATHSVQLPGGGGDRSLGQRQFVAPLARAAMAVGVDGLFMETHPEPDSALSDGPNMVPLADLPGLLRQLIAIAALA
ncbi:3-deoxy-8-phosphooctulonate synthase [Sandarakinorhabdus cyanobacteriorum]|uniref:2-dehydro-3-deoxyphosphooctonate aldolase n=1 Tax=Sandarakinorhabdus cyanobacteriorum TaxID=1981098 RepID=A0A255Y9G2_9SPHN|nr:3-deoxy-8-phosphooctulonate synthase [Sandarakinorhabdus cyanobacteriorum]OYQ25080.1 3-deoxy-8-phosphooctulonate synthase [Sandarakinorhabdus cyanobacteriorum]